MSAAWCLLCSCSRTFPQSARRTGCSPTLDTLCRLAHSTWPTWSSCCATRWPQVTGGAWRSWRPRSWPQMCAPLCSWVFAALLRSSAESCSSLAPCPRLAGLASCSPLCFPCTLLAATAARQPEREVDVSPPRQPGPCGRGAGGRQVESTGGDPARMLLLSCLLCIALRVVTYRCALPLQ